MTETTGTDPTTEAREHLSMISRGWRHALNPIKTEAGGTMQTGERAATEDDLHVPMDARIDTPLVLSFWVHAAIDEWPTIMQTLQPDAQGRLRLVTTESIDCTDVPAMCELLHREAARIAGWDESGQHFGARFVSELAEVAGAVARAAWPPKGDRMVIGDCPACGRRLRVKAPPWRRVPHPTTDPDAYPAWSDWQPHRDKPVTCKCGKEDSLEGWREMLAGPSLLLTAEQVVADIHEHMGMRYDAATVRQWARRGMVATKGYSPSGHALYDRTQILAALMARERDRERAS